MAAAVERTKVTKRVIEARKESEQSWQRGQAFWRAGKMEWTNESQQKRERERKEKREGER